MLHLVKYNKVFRIAKFKMSENEANTINQVKI